MEAQNQRFLLLGTVLIENGKCHGLIIAAITICAARVGSVMLVIRAVCDSILHNLVGMSGWHRCRKWRKAE